MFLLDLWSKLPDGIRNAIFSAALTVILGLAGYYLRPKAKIRYGISHQFAYRVMINGHEDLLRARSLWVRNVGRSAAEGIRICLNYMPSHYEFWPPQVVEFETSSDGQPIMHIKILGSKEDFTLNMLMQTADMPGVVFVKSNDGSAKSVAMMPMQVYNNQIMYFLVSIFVFGVGAIIYCLITLFTLLIR